jgi:CRP-like cAMP-binding protein
MGPQKAEQLRRLPSTRLRRLRFFRELTPLEARHLAGVGRLTTYEAGEYLATEGTRKQRRVVYVVVRGGLEYIKRIRAERASVVLRLGAGDAGGFLTLFNDEPSPVSVRSIGRTTVFEIGRQELQSLAGVQPALTIKLLTALGREMVSRLDHLLVRMAETSAWALEFAGHLDRFPLDTDG